MRVILSQEIWQINGAETLRARWCQYEIWPTWQHKVEFLISLSINFHIPSANNETGTRKSSADLYKFFLNLFQENALTWSGYLKRSFWPKTTFTAPERFWIFSNETFPLLTSERRGKRLKQGQLLLETGRNNQYITVFLEGSEFAQGQKYYDIVKHGNWSIWFLVSPEYINNFTFSFSYSQLS